MNAKKSVIMFNNPKEKPCIKAPERTRLKKKPVIHTSQRNSQRNQIMNEDTHSTFLLALSSALSPHLHQLQLKHSSIPSTSHGYDCDPRIPKFYY